MYSQLESSTLFDSLMIFHLVDFDLLAEKQPTYGI